MWCAPLVVCSSFSFRFIIYRNDIGGLNLMKDGRFGKRLKECREKKGFTQEQLAEKTGMSVGYISSVERGASFPRFENLILLLNTLEVSADSVFCDVVPFSVSYRVNGISEKLSSLPPESLSRILEVMELLIKQESEKK